MEDLIASAIKDMDCEGRIMFGYPVFFINRNMFAGLSADSVFVRHSEEVRAYLQKHYGRIILLAPMPEDR